MTKSELTQNFILNLEIERMRLGLTQAEMAKKLGLSTSGYKKIISGETSKLDMVLIYEMYKLTGKLPFELWGYDAPYLETIKKFLSLSASQKNIVSNIIDFEYNFKPEDADTEDYITLYTPTGDFDDGMIWDSANMEKINVAPYRKKFGQDLHCAIKVTSNHLNPVYFRGDILLISKRPPRNGDTAVLINNINGRAYLRKFHQTNPCQLEPINNFGETFYVDSDNENDVKQWTKFGIVLTKMRI